MSTATTSSAWPTANAIALMRHLKAEQIGCDIYYPMPLHRQECLLTPRLPGRRFPASEEACASVLALPIFPGITADQQRRVMQSCVGFLRQRLTAGCLGFTLER